MELHKNAIGTGTMKQGFMLLTNFHFNLLKSIKKILEKELDFCDKNIHRKTPTLIAYQKYITMSKNNMLIGLTSSIKYSTISVFLSVFQCSLIVLSFPIQVGQRNVYFFNDFLF